MKIMAVDLGQVRTGLAVSDPTEQLASPVGTITEKNTDKLLEKVAAAAREQGVQQLVVGHPRNMDGSRGESARWAETFAASLEKAAALPVVLWDERMIRHRLSEPNGYPRKKAESRSGYRGSNHHSAGLSGQSAYAAVGISKKIVSSV